MLSYILYFLLAIAIGFLAALFGLGGGFLIVPALTFLGVPIHHAVGTSSAIIIFSSISAVIEYRKHGSIDYKAGLLIALPSIFGAYIGAWTTMVVDESSLKLIFGIVLIMVAMRMIRHDVLIERKLKAWLIPFGGFFAGLASGLLGVGGGIINVPFLAYVGLAIHSAIATSSFAIIFTSIASTAKHYMHGSMEAIWIAIFSPGIIIGAQLGAKFAKLTKARQLKLAFALFLILIAFSMILKALI